MSTKSTTPTIAREVVMHDNPKIRRDVEALGLRSDIFCAVLESVDLSRFGVVNQNRRILPEELGQVEIDLFNERCKRETVDGDDGHPGWERMSTGEFTGIACAWLSAETYRDAEGVLRARGSVALFNNEQGRNLATLYEAGVRLGVSSRAYATFDEVYLDERSGWLNNAENKRFKDQWVDLYTSWSLGRDGTFDFVRNPSMLTYAESAGVAVKQAYESLIKANILKEDTMAVENAPAPQPDVVSMTREEHNKLVAEATATAAAAAATESAALRKAQESLTAENAALKERLVALETKAAEAEKAAREAAVKAELDSYIKTVESKVLNQALRAQADKGMLRTADEAKNFAEIMTEALKAAGVKDTTTPAPSAKADRADEATPAVAPKFRNNEFLNLSEVL